MWTFFLLTVLIFLHVVVFPSKKLHRPLPSPLFHLLIQRHNSFLVVKLKFSNTRNNSQNKSLDQTI